MTRSPERSFWRPFPPKALLLLLAIFLVCLFWALSLPEGLSNLLGAVSSAALGFCAGRNRWLWREW